MKLRHLLIILALIAQSGCMKYRCTYEVYSNGQESDMEQALNVWSFLASSQGKTHRFLGVRTSDIYSAPYTLKFIVRYTGENQSSSLIIHSVKLTENQSDIFTFSPSNSLAIPFDENQAQYTTNLNDRLDYREDRTLTLLVDWEIPKIEERQTYEAEFESNKRVKKDPMFEAFFVR